MENKNINLAKEVVSEKKAKRPKILDRFSGLGQKIVARISQTKAGKLIVDSIKRLPPKTLKMLLYAFLAMVLLLMIGIFVPKIFEKKELVAPTPTPVPTAPPTATPIPNPSRYATDSAVLKTEEEIENFDKELNEVEISESDLLPPELDFEVSF